MLPVVALVGRPNVGKSTLFNRIVGHRMAIVEDVSGVTRDRLYADCEWTGRHFTIIDTGGVLFNTSDPIAVNIRRQVDIAAEQADLILFVVDGREGITALDQEIAVYLRTKKRPVLVACNKVDTVQMTAHMYDFYAMGFEMVLPISASNGLSVGDLLDEVVMRLPQSIKNPYDENAIRVAILGKPNAGKSSLTNKLTGEERSIVTDIPGTTRDAIDSIMRYYNNEIVLIDTAGLRRKNKIKENLEHYSALRTYQAVDRCDVALIMIDAGYGLTEQDKKIAGYAHEKGKGCIVVVNKWDLVEKNNYTMDEQKQTILSEIPFLKYAPILFVSVKTGQRLTKLLDMIIHVSEQRKIRIPTSTLNTILDEATFVTPPPSDKGKRLKIYYGTQTGIKPPTFILFVNDKELCHFSYMRHLENVIRSIYPFEGTPIIWKINEKKKEG